VDLEKCSAQVTDAYDVVGSPSPLFDVSGKNAVVTGGAKGVGAMIAAALCEAGANVLVLGRDPEAGQRFTEGLEGARGSCRFLAADLARGSGVTEAAQKIGDLFDKVHVLVNNA